MKLFGIDVYWGIFLCGWEAERVSEAGRFEGLVTGGNLNFDASSSWKRNESKSKF